MTYYNFFFPSYGYMGSVMADEMATTMTLSQTPAFNGAGPIYPLESGTPLQLTTSVGPPMERRGNSYLGAVLANEGMGATCTVDYTAGMCPTLTCGDVTVRAVGPPGDQVCPHPTDPRTGTGPSSRWLQNVLLLFPNV